MSKSNPENQCLEQKLCVKAGGLMQRAWSETIVCSRPIVCLSVIKLHMQIALLMKFLMISTTITALLCLYITMSIYSLLVKKENSNYIPDS